jgi:hypothetical protein
MYNLARVSFDVARAATFSTAVVTGNLTGFNLAKTKGKGIKKIKSRDKDAKRFFRMFFIRFLTDFH